MRAFTDQYRDYALGVMERAHQAYHRRMSDEYRNMQPVNGTVMYEENEVEYVVLSNVCGILAVYRVHENGRLEWSDYIPKECLLDHGADVYEEDGQEFVVKGNGLAVLACFRVLDDGTLEQTDYIPAECREECDMAY